MSNQFSISVGRGGENVAFMNHTWDHQNPVNYVAFASSNYRTVDWNIPTNGIHIINAICLMFFKFNLIELFTYLPLLICLGPTDLQLRTRTYDYQYYPKTLFGFTGK